MQSFLMLLFACACGLACALIASARKPRPVLVRNPHRTSR